jgi:undecaprenyl phosphate N,N'-diacetylbacillosamine 1-phosphate transferase
MYRSFFKRFFDILASAMLIIVLSPVILLLIIILTFQNNGKPFFFQERPGKDAKRIRIMKFKSMTDKKDKDGNLLPDNMRITKVGAFIRKTSLDELPQFFNVLTGDMSLIGPRPLLFKYVPLYSPEQFRRHEARPGITGWAQVNGRNSISWTQKFALDVYYVDNLSFMLDLKIFWLTFLKVIRSEGVNQSADRPMNPFTGNN